MMQLIPRTTRKTISSFEDLGDLIASTSENVFQPPLRMTVSEWAEKDRYINQPGAYVGPWKNETVPYMVEPMDTLTEPTFNGLAFTGPAQCAKTDGLIVNWIGYSAVVDPMDMIVYEKSHAAARDFSIRRVDRLHRHSKAVGDAVLKTKDADNRTDKQYNNGMMLSLGHPSINELAGRPVGRVALTDYDRMDDDIEGEGSAYDLATKRTTTYGSFAMALAESSPSREVIDPKYIVQGHEAPPCGGILALYNRGDRRRWHWPCPECGSYFEGNWDHIQYDVLGSNLDSAATVRMVCPHCTYAIQPDQRHEMQQWGVWLKEGQRIGSDGRIRGEGRRSNIASFWLKGVAAGLTTWAKLVKTYLDAEDEFERTGSEEALKKFYNTDLGEPYIPKHVLADTARTPDMIMQRAYEFPVEEDEGRQDDAVNRLTAHGPSNDTPKFLKPLVPEDVRALLATVDVQQNMFIVQVHGIRAGKPYDLAIVDRFSIRKSHRLDDDGEREWVKPGSYVDDWDLIEEQVIRRSYELADGSGRKMTIKLTLCDSGGKAGVTTNAYAFVRALRKRGLGGRFHLVKGESKPGQPRFRITYPDNSKRGASGAKAGAQGDVPVLLLNANVLKDTLNNLLDVVIPGAGMIHFPDWLPDWFFAELTAEIRTDKGWANPNKRRNEAWDLLYYAIGGCVSSLLSIEKVDWENPPLWLMPVEANPLVIAAEREEAFEDTSRIDFASFGRALA
jgi:phage terminase large subunit GpA-like protein